MLDIGAITWARNKNTQNGAVLNNNDAVKFGVRCMGRASIEETGGNGGVMIDIEAMFGISALFFTAAVCVTLFAGFVKGAVGFAMPMIMISGLSLFLAPEIALAALIGPTVMANAWQALRQGPHVALQSVKKVRLFLAVGLVFLMASAQLFTVMPVRVLFLLIGVPIALFSVAQLMGWQPKFTGRGAEVTLAAIAGLTGGVSGVWGPPTVAYLTARNTPKAEHVRIQGVIYGLGAVALLLAHIQSGVVRAETVPLSLAMLVPSVFGMWVGLKLHDRMPQERFRIATLAVLVVAGLNLIWRGVS